MVRQAMSERVSTSTGRSIPDEELLHRAVESARPMDAAAWSDALIARCNLAELEARERAASPASNKPRFVVEYDNDVGPNDGGFWEWWEVHDTRAHEPPVCRCDEKAWAEKICGIR